MLTLELALTKNMVVIKMQGLTKEVKSLILTYQYEAEMKCT